MEDFFSLKYGIAGVCVLLTVMIVVKVGEFVWQIREKKEELSEKAVRELTKAVRDNTTAIHILDQKMSQLELVNSEVPKLKKDLQRFYCAVKEIAGDRWSHIRDEIMKDRFDA